jgi:Holliday junction resolvase RusA-like endonuclease
MYLLPITPKPTPRPRLGKNGVYNTSSYKAYKQNLIKWISLLKIPRNNYDFIWAKFYVPYPKSTKKSDLIDKYPLKKVFDCDNVIKGLCDALEQSGVVENDRCFCSMMIEKFRTTDKVGRIEFELTKFENPYEQQN